MCNAHDMRPVEAISGTEFNAHRILLLGAMGAGKTTLGKLLARLLHVRALSFGDFIRREVALQSPMSHALRESATAACTAASDLYANTQAVERAIEVLVSAHWSTGFVLDGYPRTQATVAHARDYLRPTHVVLLSASASIREARVMQRGRRSDARARFLARESETEQARALFKQLTTTCASMVIDTSDTPATAVATHVMATLSIPPRNIYSPLPVAHTAP
jgi:adenylate kinase family enzyme